MLMRYAEAVVAMALAALLGAQVGAQTQPASQPGPSSMTARLIDAEKKAAQQAATVEVSVSGVEMIDPAKVGEKAMTGQGHLHYRSIPVRSWRLPRRSSVFTA
jgi:hypothetical protein